MKQRSGATVLLALGLGLAAGVVLHLTLSPASAHAAADLLSLVTQAFLRLIQMIIAPLIFSTLTTAVAKAGRPAEVGRIGLRAFAWFVGASIIALAIGAALALWLRPGAGLHLVASAAPPAVPALSAGVFLQHLIPISIVDAMARNEILQVVVFSLFAGTAMAGLGQRVTDAVRLLQQLADIMFKIVDMIMHLAPAAVFCALASVIAVQGGGVVGAYTIFLLDFYLALAAVWTTLLAAAWIVGGRSPVSVLRAVRQPVLIAFSTTSSEAAYPRTLEVLLASGVRERVSSFVLPLGYAFNLDGAMVYAAFAVLFIAQAYGVALSAQQIGLMLLLLLISSKGVAGVPRAVLVVVASTLPVFNIPIAGLALLLGIDPLLDMGRSATNVLGNFVAACVVDRYEPN